MTENAPLQTAIVCYTQASFGTPDPDALKDEDDPLYQANLRAATAEKLVVALKLSHVETDIIKVPLRSFEPRDYSKVAFAWRLLDLKESNGRPIDLAICLDFPAWSIQHPRKVAWLTNLPHFVTRRTSTPPDPTRPLIPSDESISYNIQALLQAERRGLRESFRIMAGKRAIAEELARSGMQIEFNPFPPLETDPAHSAWQSVIQRLLGFYCTID